MKDLTVNIPCGNSDYIMHSTLLLQQNQILNTADLIGG